MKLLKYLVDEFLRQFSTVWVVNKQGEVVRDLRDADPNKIVDLKSAVFRIKAEEYEQRSKDQPEKKRLEPRRDQGSPIRSHTTPFQASFKPHLPPKTQTLSHQAWLQHPPVTMRTTARHSMRHNWHLPRDAIQTISVALASPSKLMLT